MNSITAREDKCDTTEVLVPGEIREITSTNFPDDYPNDERKYWCFKVGVQN